MTWLKKAWGWLKKNWKWILFPVGLTLFLLSLLANQRSIPIVGLDIDGIDKSERKKEMELSKASELRDAKLKELADAHQQRLATLTEEQERELEDLTEKPIDEVVKWFDRL